MVVTLQNNVAMFETTWNDYINSHLWSVTLHNHIITHQNNVIQYNNNLIFQNMTVMLQMILLKTKQ